MQELAWADVQLDGREEGSCHREGTWASWRRAGTSGTGRRSLLQSLALRLPAGRWEDRWLQGLGGI